MEDNENVVVSNEDVKDKVATDEVVADKVAADEVANDETATDKVVSDEAVVGEVATDKVDSDEVVKDEIVETQKVEEGCKDEPLQKNNDFNERIFNELIAKIDAHFLNVRNLLKFNKDKDENINKLTTELQGYRDGIGSKLFKSIALNLIGFREDCKKSVREFKDRGLSVDESKKYLEYLVYDFEDLLANLNIAVKGEEVYYNNKSVSAGFDGKITACNIDEYILPETPELTSNDERGVVQYLVDIENYIIEVLKSNSNLDKLLKVYIENSALYEQGIHQVVLYPVINRIGRLYNELKADVEQYIQSLNGDNTTDSFVACSEKSIEKIDSILTNCSVTIESFVSDRYDPQKHRLLKVIYSENQDENGKIANIYSDCYLMDGRVIYPQKVDVIKYKEKI